MGTLRIRRPMRAWFAGWHVDDGSLLAVFGLFWAVSLARVVSALVRHEVFGAEATLALLAVVAVPWIVLAGRTRSGSA